METPSHDLGFVGLMETMDTHKDVSISYFGSNKSKFFKWGLHNKDVSISHFGGRVHCPRACSR